MPQWTAKAGVPFYHAVSRGIIDGAKAITKFGRNPATGSGSFEDIWPAGAAFVYPTTAAAVRIQAGGNAADAAAGTGARKVLVQGLDANYNEVTEALATAGASASAFTTTPFIRVVRAYVTEVGSGGQNTGDITIENAAGAVTAFIDAGEGQTQQLIYTIPNGYTGHIVGWAFDISDQEGAGAIVQHVGHFRGQVRLYNTASTNNYESWRTVFDLGLDTDGSGSASGTEHTQIKLPARTDVRVQVFSRVANAEATGRLYIVLYEGEA